MMSIVGSGEIGDVLRGGCKVGEFGTGETLFAEDGEPHLDE